MALNKQIHIYSVDTSAFYNENEIKIHKKLNKYYLFKKKLNERLIKYNKLNNKKSIDEIKDNYILLISITEYNIKVTNKKIQKIKEELLNEFKENKNVRNLNKEYLNKYNIISVFESTLTRVMQVPENTLSKNIIIVQTYFFDVIEDIILDGFMYDNEKYVCLTASAGQIRTKKTVFIKESILNKYKNTLTCGLTIDIINEHGGVNINKYLAYLALCNSATDLWKEFDINRTIVVDDFETDVDGVVDLIDDVTYEIEKNKKMKIPIPHTDGCGMILPKKSKKNMMVRLPWIKGLLVCFPYDKFIREANEKDKSNNHGIIKDIYGKEHDVLKEKIEIIFTKSQFKMWKYYENWDTYKRNFIRYQCQAGKCNEEDDVFNNAKLNYQMLQTLTDMTDDELEIICKTTKNNIMKIGKDRETMLKVLGVTPSNINKNYMQQALEIYPELLNDTYNKEILKQVKKSMVKQARAGKLDIDGKYTFISPDLYAFCEYLFLGDKNPNGLLENREVYCRLFKNTHKLDCLRSPHLYREHAIRKNVAYKDEQYKERNDEIKRWFTTNAIYTSCHDIISKILMFDVDGDKSLVCADDIFVKVAERNMKDIVPLYYNMRKAEAEKITSQNIFNGLKAAYTGGNIGMISNDITKIWNSENVNLDVIKLLCLENNFTIDYAKTLYKPERPKNKKSLITNYTKLKTPHFFIYAKDKTKDKVEKNNNSVVNRLEKMIPNPRINFKATNLGKFDYRMLMNDKNIKLDKNIIEKYTELDLKKPFLINKIEDEKTSNTVFLYEDIKNKLLEVNNDIKYITDVLVKYLYNEKKSSYKTTLWECFGDVIVENLKNNITFKLNEGVILCEVCGKRIEDLMNNRKYCKECAKEIKKQQDRIADKKYKERKRREKSQLL